MVDGLGTPVGAVGESIHDADLFLCMTVNPGWGGASNGPIDWPYTQGFITGLVDELNGARAPGWIAGAHLARYFEVNAKLAQKANTNLPFDAPNPAAPTDIWTNGGLQSKADLDPHESKTHIPDLPKAESWF